MQEQFRTPKTTRFLALTMLALVALDFSGTFDASMKAPLRGAIGLVAIAALAWFLLAVMRFRR